MILTRHCGGTSVSGVPKSLNGSPLSKGLIAGHYVRDSRDVELIPAASEEPGVKLTIFLRVPSCSAGWQKRNPNQSKMPMGLSKSPGEDYSSLVSGHPKTYADACYLYYYREKGIRIKYIKWRNSMAAYL